MIRSVYLEHSFLSKEENWDNILFLSCNKDYDIVISDWSIVEISRDGDRSRSLKRADFLDQINTRWLINFEKIHEKEFISYLNTRFLKLPISPFIVFSKFPFNDENFQSKYKDVKGMANDLLDKPENLRTISNSINESIKSYSLMKTLPEKALKNLSNKSFENKIKNYLENLKLIDVKLSSTPLFGKREIFNEIIKNKESFLKRCPAINFEEEFFLEKYKDKKRKTRSSDPIDNMHVLSAIPYCDYIVIDDKYLRHTCDITSKKLGYGNCIKDINELIS